MSRAGPIVRISLGLVLLTVTIVLGLDLIGWLPKAEDTNAELNLRIAETVAAQATADLDRSDLRGIRATLHMAVSRNEALRSAGLRSPQGRLLIAMGPHDELWHPPDGTRSSATHIRIPLYRDGELWATMELRFDDEQGGDLLTKLQESPLPRILLFVAVTGFFSYGIYMRRTLRYLDPSSVIPQRVQATLDVMTEGVVVIDKSDEIVMANAAFAERFGCRPPDLMGRKASSLGWRDREGREIAGGLPWIEAMREGSPFKGRSLALNRSARERILLAVNGAPILDGWGRPTGAIVTFDDVTEVERSRTKLEAALQELEKSRDEIRLQNEELQQLAERDPLTGAANRRSFMTQMEPRFEQAREDRHELACLMVDIDHFKRVNDEHGHATGDAVIRRVADALMSQLGGRGVVCRYGGEEFCVALPGVSSHEAEALGERIRRQIEAPGFASVPVTVSLGLATTHDHAHKLSVLIDQADQALYASKESGRNRLTRFDQVPSNPARRD